MSAACCWLDERSVAAAEGRQERHCRGCFEAELEEGERFLLDQVIPAIGKLNYPLLEVWLGFGLWSIGFVLLVFCCYWRSRIFVVKLKTTTETAG